MEAGMVSQECIRSRTRDKVEHISLCEAEHDVQIYVMAHKPFVKPDDPIYVPVHVGRSMWIQEHPDEKSELLTYVGDDSGDHISEQNGYYSELTGMYWAWKNTGADYIGICHYRRYLLDHDGTLFNRKQVVEVLRNYDMITTKNLQLNFPYEEGFIHHHKKMYLDATAEAIQKLYPEYTNTFEKLMQEKHTYFGNMLITRKETYDAYMTWLFDILFTVQAGVKVEEEDSYHRRIFGFLSEFLQYVWIVHNRLKVYECMVGMLGEKAEVTETKRKLAEFFKKRDYEGAKQYFLAAKKARPDLLMEASDITGELHLCMEIIAIAGLEQEKYGSNLLDRCNDFAKLMHYGNELNRYALSVIRGEEDVTLKQWAKENGISDVALEAACAVMRAAE